MVVSSNVIDYSEALATGIRRDAMTGSFILPAKPIAVTHVTCSLPPVMEKIIREAAALKYKGIQGSRDF